MADLSLSNIINVSVSEAPAGLGEYNTSNVALFSHEPFAESFGDLGYKIYLEPTEVGTDFGTDSETYNQALLIFGQAPNILANNGYLVVIPFVEAIQHLALSGVAASGSFILNYGAEATAAINWNDAVGVIQTKLQALAGLESVVVGGSIASQSLTVNFSGVEGPIALLTITSNTLETSGSTSITFTVTTTQAGETFAAAITRASSLVQFFGIIVTLVVAQAALLAAAAVVQAMNKVMVIVGSDPADVATGGKLDLLRTGGFTKTRGLFYGDSNPLDFPGAFAGRGFSTNFDGSNTTQNMHLKDLSGVQPDSTLNQTLLDLCTAAGADVYGSFQGIPKIFESGANRFFDQVYNEGWLVGAIQIAGFNYLATASTKIPQTENGMDGLKGAYRQVCEQANANAYSAPGKWNSATTFGVQSDFLQNITQRGYYIYSTPIAQQSQADRAARKAPLVQIALKESGGINSSTVIVVVNA